MRFQLNLTIQILLKQGQVELENFQLLLEYPDAILINKSIIEDLNSVIRVIIIFNGEESQHTTCCTKFVHYSPISVINNFHSVKSVIPNPGCILESPKELYECVQAPPLGIVFFKAPR